MFVGAFFQTLSGFLMILQLSVQFCWFCWCPESFLFRLAEFLMLGITKGQISLAYLCLYSNPFRAALPVSRTSFFSDTPLTQAIMFPGRRALLCCQEAFRNLEPLSQIHPSLPHPSWNLGFPWWHHFPYNPQGESPHAPHTLSPAPES